MFKKLKQNIILHIARQDYYELELNSKISIFLLKKYLLLYILLNLIQI